MNFDTAVKYLPARKWLQIGLLVLSVFIFAACGFIGGGGEEAPAENPEATPLPSAKVTCSEICRNEGQCGDNADGQVVVLGNSVEPQTRIHDQLFPNDANVVIVDTQDKMVKRPTTGEEFLLPFFRARENVENGQEGWITSWCVTQ